MTAPLHTDAYRSHLEFMGNLRYIIYMSTSNAVLRERMDAMLENTVFLEASLLKDSFLRSHGQLEDDE